jgi:hypothetical protein
VTSRHSYPVSAVLGDYARSLIGLALVLPLVLVSASRFVVVPCLGIALLFLAFGGRTLARQLRRIEMDEAGIDAIGPFPKRIDWSRLEDMRLAYFATRRDGERGWIELALRAGKCRLKVDSRIENFRAIVDHAARAARRRQVKLNQATAANLVALGIAPDGAAE